MDPHSKEIDATARKFLRSGRVGHVEPAELARACDAIVTRAGHRSLTGGLKMARKLAKAAEGSPQPLPRTAARVLARFLHMNNRYEEAEAQYRRARGLAARDAVTKAKIDRALIDVYMYLRQPAKAARCARRALETFERAGMEADMAMTRVNLANLLHRQDRHNEAERLYRQAGEYFLRHNNDVAVARCFYNRANTLTQLFNLDEAEGLYREAEQIYRRHERLVDANDARYGMAWLMMLRGEFHRALIELAACEEAYARLGQRRGVALCLLDRAEVYIGLNLLTDALETSRQAERKFRGLKLEYEAAKAAFFHSLAAAGLNLKRRARNALVRSRRGFKSEKNAGFTAALELHSASLSASPEDHKRKLVTARRLFGEAQLPLWQAVSDLHFAELEPDDPDVWKRLQRNPAVRSVPHLYARWQTSMGDRELGRNRLKKARRHWQQAADLIDMVRAQLPPVELRSGFGRDMASPHTRLIETEAQFEPGRAAAWAERYKTSGIWSPLRSVDGQDPARLRAEKSLTELAQRVAALSVRVSSSSGERGFAESGQKKAVRELRQQVRTQLARLEQTADRSPNSPEWIAQQFRETSRVRPIVQFLFSGESLMAFVHENGHTRLVRWPDGGPKVETFLRRWRFYIEAEVFSGNTSANNRNEKAFFEEVGSYLWEPLEISADYSHVTIIPDGALSNLPWPAIEVDGQSLAERHLFVISPSLQHQLKADGPATRSRSIMVFVPAASDLPAIQDELQVLQSLAGKALHLFHPAARQDWPHEGTARVWHFSGHAEFRQDNPFYSYLSMTDGPMFAADFRLRNYPVDLVVLAACRSGEQVATPGEESLGLVRSMLEMGARNVIAGHWPVADGSAARWTTAFYERYLRGVELREAVRGASLSVREKCPSAYHWAAFSVFGSQV